MTDHKWIVIDENTLGLNGWPIQIKREAGGGYRLFVESVNKGLYHTLRRTKLEGQKYADDMAEFLV